MSGAAVVDHRSVGVVVPPDSGRFGGRHIRVDVGGWVALTACDLGGVLAVWQAVSLDLDPAGARALGERLIDWAARAEHRAPAVPASGSVSVDVEDCDCELPAAAGVSS